MIKVNVDIGNRYLSEKLAERICELSENILVTVGKGTEGAEEVFDIVIDDNYDGRIFPVSGLVDEILSSYSIKTGKPFYGPETAFRKVFYFTSPFGGSGTSSIALVFARHLSGRKNEKVLFVDTGRDGLIYGEFIRENEGGYEELKYVIRKERPLDPGRYLSLDYYGPECIRTGREDMETVIGAIASQRPFTALVCVSDPPDGEFIKGTVIQVLDVKDARYLAAVRDEKGFTVHNRDYINRVNDRIISIADDPLSFKCPSDRVIISMDGEFALGTEKLMREVMREYEY